MSLEEPGWAKFDYSDLGEQAVSSWLKGAQENKYRKWAEFQLMKSQLEQAKLESIDAYRQGELKNAYDKLDLTKLKTQIDIGLKNKQLQMAEQKLYDYEFYKDYQQATKDVNDELKAKTQHRVEMFQRGADEIALDPESRYGTPNFMIRFNNMKSGFADLADDPGYQRAYKSIMSTNTAATRQRHQDAADNMKAWDTALKYKLDPKGITKADLEDEPAWGDYTDDKGRPTKGIGLLKNPVTGTMDVVSPAKIAASKGRDIDMFGAKYRTSDLHWKTLTKDEYNDARGLVGNINRAAGITHELDQMPAPMQQAKPLTRDLLRHYMLKNNNDINAARTDAQQDGYDSTLPVTE